MNSLLLKELVKKLLSGHLDIINHTPELEPVGGGSINHSYKVKLGRNYQFFLKTNSASRFPHLFEKEKKGLQFLALQKCIQIPDVIFCETHSGEQLLLLEWIESGIRTEYFWKSFGEQLAQLHHITQEQFGFGEDNYMGALSQANKLTPEWRDFFIHYRLQPQVELARGNNLLEKKHIAAFENLYENLGSFFSPERPSLLHGDLWSGNFICSSKSMPVLVDPAIYFGHRSIDLAMTRLFGGFDRLFYDAYHFHFPLPPNYIEQWDICNLYPLLVHLNLFGKGYLHDINAILKKYS